MSNELVEPSHEHENLQNRMVEQGTKTMQIKICGLYRDVDVDAVNEAAPDWAGFIINVPFSHRSISAKRAAKLVSRLNESIKPVGVFFNSPPEEIADAAELAGFSIVQLHGDETNEDIELIRNLFSGRSLDCQIWKAFKIENEESIAKARESSADLVLLDGGTGEGRTFNWQLCTMIDRPFIVAGGLSQENIADAFEATSAFACDLSSGVETNKMKDPIKIKAAVDVARSIE